MKILSQNLMLLVTLLFSAMCSAEDLVLKDVLQADSSQPGKLGKTRKVVIAWSRDDHPPMTHGYRFFAKLYGDLFSKVAGVQVISVEGFPDAESWKEADLVLFYLTIKELNDTQYALLDAHLAKGKGLIVLHQGIVQRKRTSDWADRIGYSYRWDKDKGSKWGGFSGPVTFDVSHPIFAGFPKSVPYRDELYWRLEKGKRGVVTDLATAKAPANKEKSDQQWPVYWTVEHEAVGDAPKGRVFGCVIGHYNKHLEQRIFMTALGRAMAWCLYDEFEPFKAPLRELK